MIKSKHALGVAIRFAALGGAVWFASIDRNPIVVFLARTGLSPSPLERLFGLKGFFSGMTEGMHRMVHGDFSGAVDANPYTPLVAAIFAICLVFGVRPRIRKTWHEVAFLGAVLLLTLVRNFPPVSNR